VVFWSGIITTADRKRLKKLIKKASSVVVGDRRMMAKLSSLMNHSSHPMQDTLAVDSSPVSEGEVPQVLPSRCCQAAQQTAVDRWRS